MGMVYRQKGRTIWLMKYYRDGRPIVESSGTDDEKEARKTLRDRETDIGRGVPVTAKVGRLRFDEAAKDVINDYKVNQRKSLAVLERRITKHLMPYFRGRRMSTLTTPDVRAYITHRQEQGIVAVRGKRKGQRIGDVSSAEINRELDALKRAFTLAVQSGKLLYKPHIPKLAERNVRTGFFERHQFESVCAHLPGPLQAVMRFAYVTGWRVDSEVLPLEWRQVDFKAKITPDQPLPGTVTLDPLTTKNGEGRVFPFTAELTTILTAQRAAADALKENGMIVRSVFFRMVAEKRGGDKKPKPILKFAKAWRNACFAAGAPGRIPHDLRRTAVRNLVRAGVPERVAMQLTGHKTRSVFERYNIVSDGDLSVAAARLDAAHEAAADASTGEEYSEGSASANRSANRPGRFPAVSGGAGRQNS